MCYIHFPCQWTRVVKLTIYLGISSRAASTLNITFSDLALARSDYEYNPAKPIFVEKFRESISPHTCDHRRTKGYLHQTYPTYNFEPGFSQDDRLWQAGLGESASHQEERLREALDEVFIRNQPDGNDINAAGNWVSITAHSGAIGSILQGTHPSSDNKTLIIARLY